MYDLHMNSQVTDLHRQFNERLKNKGNLAELIQGCQQQHQIYFGYWITRLLRLEHSDSDSSGYLREMEHQFLKQIQTGSFTPTFDPNQLEQSVMESVSNYELFSIPEETQDDLEYDQQDDMEVDVQEYSSIPPSVVMKSEVVEEVRDPPPSIITEVPVRATIQILCNWATSAEVAHYWTKMTQGNHRWGSLQLVWDDHPSYWVIINRPPDNAQYDPKRTIVFQMEPMMTMQPWWGPWARPDPCQFLQVHLHTQTYNNLEWHLKQTYTELSSTSPCKDPSFDHVLSTVLSGKYFDVGHIKRIDFIRYIDSHMTVHVYGSNTFNYRHYQRPLPYHEKDDALMPYKYTFNAENTRVTNYVTEKLVDAILSESLCFYYGCPNIHELIDPMAYVPLDLVDFDHDLRIIQQAMATDLWSQRIDVIRKEKHRILNELQFFPRLERLLFDDTCPKKRQEQPHESHESHESPPTSHYDPPEKMNLFKNLK
jgi:hypothetical protein